MTALEAYNLTTKGGGADFGRVIDICNLSGPYCLIGGLAVNCYVEPVYTLDADLVVTATRMPEVLSRLEEAGFRARSFRNSVNLETPSSDLRIQFTTDERYQDFPARAENRTVLGTYVRVACLDDIVQGKLWAYADPERRLTKRKKDELDLIRLAEAYPYLRAKYPAELGAQLDSL